MSQFELFSQPVQQTSATPSVEAVRARLEGLMRTLRTSDVLPLTEKQLRFWRTVVPQMTDWLPPEEAAAIRDEFQAHLNRLDRAAA